jgi:uncharacterized protein
MDPFNRNNAYPQSQAQSTAAVYDEGLRAYMLGVYNYMASALALTGLVAYVTANTPALLNLFYATNAEGQMGFTLLGWVMVFAPLVLVMIFTFKINSMSYGAAKALFWAFAVAMGLSLANIFLLYTGASIARTFFITAATFGAMSLYGYTTKRDLTGWGSFLIMGLLGLIIASIVNIFLQSTALHWTISVVGVGLFVGLTAYDTQRIKATYYAVAGNAEMMAKSALMGALNLYMDFINLFIMLLRFFGERR